MTRVSFRAKLQAESESAFEIQIFGHFDHFGPPYMVKSGNFSNFIKKYVIRGSFRAKLYAEFSNAFENSFYDNYEFF